VPSPPPSATPVLAISPPVAAREKWIDVDLTHQRMTAYEGNTPVFQALVSSGLPNTPTVVGQFHIYWKLSSTDMAGPGYYLPGVPYTMYFYRGYALHGTYWHNNFGRPMSHGCVNLRTEDAQWLFNWADPPLPGGASHVRATDANPGTLVVVHY
jgi:lipoprotein-anchoring transpeptidase ErfK/SrfK